ncbi:MAG: hypothetical protein EBR30_01530 [Cytophagia bacterium]|nr:hypothetical protein [Cytophagia bacterium]
MCPGGDCSLKDKCYRYTAPADEDYQMYFVNPPYKDNDCEYFWGDAQEAILNQLKDIVNGKED